MEKRMLIIGIAVMILAASCGGNEAPEDAGAVAEKVTNVAVYTVTPTDFEEYITLPAVVSAYREVNLGLTNGGRVTTIHTDKGDRVSAGDVLLETDDVVLRANLQNAEATVEYNRKEFQRSEKLFREGSITEAAYDAAKFQLTQSESALDIARKRLEEATLEAPFAGTVTGRMAEVGDLLGPGSPAFRIVDTDRVKINTGIPEKYIADFKKGNRVIVHFDAIPGERFKGTIDYVSPEANTSVRTFPAEIVVKNRDGIIRPGIMGDARLLRKVHENALMVPVNAVVEAQEGRSVLVALPDSTAEKRTVEIGASSDLFFMVTKGVQSGDRVIVRGQHDLVSGERVNITGDYEARESAEDSE